MADNPQTVANHVRWDPPFHFFVLPVAFISFIYSVVHLFRFPSLSAAWMVIVAIAAVIVVFRERMYPLSVQDRVIRLEERLRLNSVLDEPLRSRIGELTDAQLIALRFAADKELPSLVRRCVDEKLPLREIKKAIVTWRPDYSRV